MRLRFLRRSKITIQLLLYLFSVQVVGYSLCNAYHLGDPIFIEEHYQKTWTTVMKTLLAEMKEPVENTELKLDYLIPEQITAFEYNDDDIVTAGLVTNPLPN